MSAMGRAAIARLSRRHGSRRFVIAAEPPRQRSPSRALERESIIGELATWLLSGTAIDAAFMARHGPPGLVAAARRVFGRFEAAMNVAVLHNARLYPEGPPTRGATPGQLAMTAAASRPSAK